MVAKARGQLMKTEEGKNGINYDRLLNESLRIFFKDALRITLRNPSQAYFFYRTIRWQKKAARVRLNWEKQDIPVPPIIIFSITNRCNLQCKGCYAQSYSSWLSRTQDQ